MSMDDRTSLALDIEEAADGEPIEAVVISAVEGVPYRLEGVIPADKSGVVLSWEQARPLLDYPYSAGYGGVDSHAFWAWTANRVLFLGCYDGAQWIDSVPRNPTPGDPDSVGGG